jgi:hypothetical protein
MLVVARAVWGDANIKAPVVKMI